MIDVVVSLALASGMVAAFNPCGFSLLPAYIGAFVVGDDVADETDRRVARAVAVAAAVSAGFVVVFSTIGLAINLIADGVGERLPWVTIVVGAALVVAGTATVAGWHPRFAVVVPQLGGGSCRRTAVMVGFGITYAVASLSCTLGPFLAVTGVAFVASPWGAASVYLAYALGMGIVILAISLASAFTHTTLAVTMRRFSRVAPRMGGLLMVLAGAYAVWYGRWELAVYDGNQGRDPLIARVEQVRLAIVSWIMGVGAVQLALAIVIGTSTILMVARRSQRRSSTGDPAPPVPAESRHR